MPSTVIERYAALVSEGEVERDSAQEAVALRLTRLEERLAQHRLSRKSSHLGWLFAKSKPEGPIKGLYIYGEVGRGKTMLMDMFFAASDGAAKAPRALPRIHGRRARARARLPPEDQIRRDHRTTIRSA